MTNSDSNNRLAEAMKQADLTQAELARQLQTSHVVVNRWVMGHFKPNRFHRPLIVKQLRAHGVEITEEELWRE